MLSMYVPPVGGSILKQFVQGDHLLENAAVDPVFQPEGGDKGYLYAVTAAYLLHNPLYPFAQFPVIFVFHFKFAA